MKKILILALILGLLLTSMLQNSIFAEETREPTEQEKENFVTLAKNAYCMFHMIDTEYYYYCSCQKIQNPIGVMPEDIVKFIENNGYYGGVTEPIFFDKNDHFIGPKESYPYADKMNSFEVWEEDICKYFAKGVLMYGDGYLSDDGIEKSHVFLHDGKTYAYCQPPYRLDTPAIFWETAELRFTGEKSAVLYVQWYDYSYTHNPDPDRFNNDTITFLKSSDGWRVDGGSYFNGHLLKLSTPVEVPDTADNSVVYIALASVSVIALAGVTLVSAKRKKDYIA